MGLRYMVRYFFDHPTSTCLWSANTHTSNTFGYAIDPHSLPMSREIVIQVDYMVRWYQQSAGIEPGDPGLWRQEECDRFNQAAHALLLALRRDLGDSFEVSNEYKDLHAHPDIDVFLADPEEYRRQRLNQIRLARDQPS